MFRSPVIVALAGPNGAGKSTFYEAHLRLMGLLFVNADEIARISGCEAYAAAAAADALRRKLIEGRESYVFETVFSDPVGDKVAFLKQAKEQGYDVTLIYIGLNSWEQSEERVSMRVAQGGHDVPTEKLRTRYGRSLKNLALAMELLPKVYVYDNSDMSDSYRLLACFNSGKARQLADDLPAWFAELMKER